MANQYQQTLPGSGLTISQALCRLLLAYNKEQDAKHYNACLAAAKAYQIHAAPLEPRTELTAQGEQFVIPGCEANASPRAKQLSLWG